MRAKGEEEVGCCEVIRRRCTNGERRAEKSGRGHGQFGLATGA